MLASTIFMHKNSKKIIIQKYPQCQVTQVGWCFTALSAQIGYIVPWTYEIYCIRLTTNTSIKQQTK